ncbi:ABC transporter substrate-binding protein [bacterium]|nr:ABC transporter substrate-binding protein [bacterium]MBU1754299.1 ABC transporter substrate-binding protein [bacterium]
MTKYIVFLLTILLSGCVTPRDTNTLQLRLSSDPTTLDPALMVDVVGGIVGAKIFNGLVKYGDDMRIIGDIAEKWDISPDGKTYTFYLRKNVKFTNDRLVDANDFKYSFQRILLPETKSPRRWVFKDVLGADEIVDRAIKGFVVKDGHTFQIILTKPFAPFLGFLAMPAGYVVPREEVEKWGEDFSEHVVGTGPFLLTKWVHDDMLILKKNIEYFDKKPAVNSIEYRVIPEDLTAMAEFESGTLDTIGLPMAEFQRFTSSAKWKKNIVGQVGLNAYYLGINCQKKPFDDIRVRQALNYAIDKKAILETILQKQGVLSHGPIPPILSGYNCKLPAYEYNPQKAKELLKDAGCQSLRLKIYQKPSREVLNITEVIQSQLKDAGITAEIVQVEWSALKEMINQGKCDTFYLAWLADYPDAENFLAPLFHSENFGAGGNRAQYKNEKVDKLIHEAQTTSNEKKRLKIYQQVETIIHDEAPWVFLWHQKEFAMHQSWVKNYKCFPIYNADKGVDVRIVKRF